MYEVSCNKYDIKWIYIQLCIVPVKENGKMTCMGNYKALKSTYLFEKKKNTTYVIYIWYVTHMVKVIRSAVYLAYRRYYLEDICPKVYHYTRDKWSIPGHKH